MMGKKKIECMVSTTSESTNRCRVTSLKEMFTIVLLYKKSQGNSRRRDRKAFKEHICS